MALSFTNIPDHQGAALYVVYDGTMSEQNKWERFAAKVAEESGAQTACVSVKEADGEKIRDFYDLNLATLPHVLIVRDTDEVVQNWSGNALPQPSDVVYVLRQVGI